MVRGKDDGVAEVKGVEDPFVEQDDGGAEENPGTARLTTLEKRRNRSLRIFVKRTRRRQLGVPKA
jgi:hypothetical protein